MIFVFSVCIHVCKFGGDEIECYLSIQGMYGYIKLYTQHNLLCRVVVGYQIRVRVPEQVPGYRYNEMGMGIMKWVWVRVRVPSHVETRVQVRVRVPQWVLGCEYQAILKHRYWYHNGYSGMGTMKWRWYEYGYQAMLKHGCGYGYGYHNGYSGTGTGANFATWVRVWVLHVTVYSSVSVKYSKSINSIYNGNAFSPLFSYGYPG